MSGVARAGPRPRTASLAGLALPPRPPSRLPTWQLEPTRGEPGRRRTWPGRPRSWARRFRASAPAQRRRESCCRGDSGPWWPGVRGGLAARLRAGRPDSKPLAREVRGLRCGRSSAGGKPQGRRLQRLGVGRGCVSTRPRRLQGEVTPLLAPRCRGPRRGPEEGAGALPVSGCPRKLPTEAARPLCPASPHRATPAANTPAEDAGPRRPASPALSARLTHCCLPRAGPVPASRSLDPGPGTGLGPRNGIMRNKTRKYRYAQENGVEIRVFVASKSTHLLIGQWEKGHLDAQACDP